MLDTTKKTCVVNCQDEWSYYAELKDDGKLIDRCMYNNCKMSKPVVVGGEGLDTECVSCWGEGHLGWTEESMEGYEKWGPGESYSFRELDGRADVEPPFKAVKVT